jgi:plasmid stabilization system protein ParE
MMEVLFSEFALKELDDASTYYELEYSGLGSNFREEIKKTIERIVEHPLAWSIERGEVRRALLHRFPFKILYSIEKDYIFIIAIAHQHRKPEYWVQ